MVFRIFNNHIKGINQWGYRKKDELRWEFSIKRQNFNHGGNFGKMIFIKTRKYSLWIYLDRTNNEIGVGGTSRVFIWRKITQLFKKGDD